jgi:hypothetical protein
MSSARVQNLIAASPAFPNSWPVPDMTILGSARRDAPRFPSEAIGPGWAKIAATLAESCATPVDYIAAGILSVGAGLIGNARRVSPWQGWQEPSILWCMAVGDPSAGKTPAFSAIMRRLDPLETAMRHSFDAVKAQLEEQSTVAKAACEAWETKVREAVKKGDTPPRKPEAANIPALPICPQVVVNATTPEALFGICGANPKGVIFARDELAGWALSFGRYGDDGERARWLEAYNGQQSRIDRKKADPLVIPHFSVSIFGGIQPERLHDVVLKEVDDGLAARFLYFWPVPVPPARPSVTPDYARIESAIAKLHQLSLVSVDSEKQSPQIVMLDDDAANLFQQWRFDHFYSQPDSALLKGHFGKMPGLVLRLALVLEFLWWTLEAMPEPQTVSLAAIEAAAGLVDEYFKPMALRVFGDAAIPKGDKLAAQLGRWLVRTKRARFNTRHARRTPDGPGIRDAGDMNQAIEVLVDAGWIEPAGERSGQTPGRAKADYVVNPKVWEA